MNLKWFGQSCFYLTSSTGTRVLLDPFAKWFGYRMPRVEAEVVTTSHDHLDHNYIQAVDGNFYHIDQPGNYQVGDISIRGTQAWHDAFQGSKRGRNIIYNFGVDGLNVCHLGDLGHLLSSEQLANVGKVDILLLPVGGRSAITVAEALDVRKQIKPVITIPMHYRTPELGLGGFFFARVDDFICIAGEPVREIQELSIDLDSLQANAGIILLKYDQPLVIK